MIHKNWDLNFQRSKLIKQLIKGLTNQQQIKRYKPNFGNVIDINQENLIKQNKEV